MYVIRYLQASFESSEIEDALKAQERLFDLVYNAIIGNLLTFTRERKYVQEATKNFCEALEEGGMEGILTNTAEKFRESFLTADSLDFHHNKDFYCLFLSLCPEKFPKKDSEVIAEFYVLAKKLTAGIVLPALEEYYDYYKEQKFAPVVVTKRDTDNTKFIGYFPVGFPTLLSDPTPVYISKMLKLKKLSNAN